MSADSRKHCLEKSEDLWSGFHTEESGERDEEQSNGDTEERRPSTSQLSTSYIISNSSNYSRSLNRFDNDIEEIVEANGTSSPGSNLTEEITTMVSRQNMKFQSIKQLLLADVRW